MRTAQQLACELGLQPWPILPNTRQSGRTTNAILQVLELAEHKQHVLFVTYAGYCNKQIISTMHTYCKKLNIEKKYINIMEMALSSYFLKATSFKITVIEDHLVKGIM